MDDNSDSQKTGASNRDTQCSICKSMFTQRGLKRHHNVAHGRSTTPSVSVSDSISYNLMEEFMANLVEARDRIPVMRIVPRKARRLVGACFTKVLDDVVQLRDSRSWTKLMSFSFLVLRLPPAGRKSKQRLYQIVKENLQAFNGEKDLMEVLNLYPKRRRLRTNGEKLRLKQAMQKLTEGDVRAAVRHLVSADTVAEMNDEVLKELKERHPASPLDDRRINFPIQESNMELISIRPEDVRSTINSFSVASSGGIDGMRP